MLLDGGGDDSRVELAGYDDPSACQQGPDREPQRGRVVHRAEHEVHVVGAKAPQVTFLGDQGLCLGGLEQAGEHALGAAGGAAGEMDRATQRWSGGRVVGECCEELLELLLGGHDHGWLEVGEQ